MMKLQSRSLKSANFIESDVVDYFRLLKPRVMSLVVFSALLGLLLAKHVALLQSYPISLHWFQQVLTILFIAMGAGAAGALNMWLERDLDAKMLRTMQRPLPMGRVDSDNALAFALILAVSSVLLLGLAVNYVSAGLLAFTIFYYAVIYTLWLKKYTAQNVVLGGVAGALPPVIAFLAMLPAWHKESLLLFLLIFIWTPPHSWALALFRQDDYKRARIPMLPIVRGLWHTKIQILVYSLLLLPTIYLFYVWNVISLPFLLFAIVITLGFILLAGKLLLVIDKTELLRDAKILFYYSIFYLSFFLLGLMADLAS